MADFKTIVEVLHNNPARTLEKLAEVLKEDRTFFSKVSLDWVIQQKYITAYPYTLSFKEASVRRSPKPKYTVAALSEEEVHTLIEQFDYTLYEACRGGFLKRYSLCPRHKDEDGQVNADDRCCRKQEEDTQLAEEDQNPKRTYKINGQEVSQDVFKEKIREFDKMVEEFIAKLY